MIKKLTHSYYAKIILICTLLVISITGSLLYACHKLILKQDISEYLSKCNITINKQSSELTSRISNFSDIFFSLINNSQAYDALCELYLSPNGKLSTESKEPLMETLSNMCNTDNNCVGLLLVTRTGLLYQYDPRYTTLQSLNLSKTTFRFTPYEVKILTDSQITEMSIELDKPVDHIYGLTGTVFSHKDDNVKNLGYIIVLYSTEKFSSQLADSSVIEKANFTIMDETYNIVYSSSNNYTKKKLLFLPDATYNNSSTSVELSGVHYYVSSFYNDKYHFYSTCQLPASSLSYSSELTVVIMLGLFITLSSILLYGYALLSSNKRVTNIVDGMELIGQNNLSYRMTEPKSYDEFTHIIQSLNRMCDKLQQNVENTYLFEISQRKAELYAMQTSINPHFLYNALEQIHVQILHQNLDNASHMLLLLSKMYRYQTKRDLFISIAEECAQMENLINLYSYRITNCEYEINVDNSIKKYGIPKNILQPLIENCFIHGFQFEQNDNILNLSITPLIKDDNLKIHFLLEDNGTTMTAETLVSIIEKLSDPVLSRDDTNGFALSNVNTRLKLIYGESATLLPFICESGGFGVQFTIPAILPEELANRLQQNVPINYKTF